MEGKLNMMSAFTQKKLKISGNMSIAMRLNQVFASIAGKKKPAAAAAPTTAVKTATPSTTVASASKIASTTTKHKSGVFFDEIDSKIKQEGAALVSKVGAVIGFDITCPNNQTISYVIDLKTAPGSVFVNDGSKFKKKTKQKLRI